MTEGLPSRSCPACGTSVGGAPRLIKGGHSIFRCDHCGLCFVHPIPDKQALRAIYGTSYFQRGSKYADDPTSPSRRALRKNDMRRVSRISQYTSDGPLLDFGCGMGNFLEAARDAGFRVCGTDISTHALQHVQTVLEIPAVPVDELEAHVEADSLNVVTLWDALEHLPDAHGTLRRLFPLMRDRAWLFISTGDAHSRWARLCGAHWPLLTPPQHLTFHTPRSLEALLHAAGFEVVACYHDAKWVSMEFALFKAEETLGRWLRPIRLFARVSRLNRLHFPLNLGDIVTCVARKR